MKKLFTKKGMIVVVIAIIIAIITTATISISKKPGFITNAVNSLVKPIRIVAASVAGSYESLFGYIYKYDDVVTENEELRAEVADLKAGYREYEELSEENERLRELLNLSARNADYVFDMAAVVSWSSSNWESMFTISKGSTNSDIAVGDSVITESGALVGVVTSVEATTSTCISVLDTHFSASSLIENTGETVVAQGDFSHMKKDLFTVDYIGDSTIIYTGDAVMTSGKGGMYPKGLLVGYIIDIIEKGSGLGMYATVEPAVDLKNISDVFVITEFDLTD